MNKNQLAQISLVVIILLIVSNLLFIDLYFFKNQNRATVAQLSSPKFEQFNSTQSADFSQPIDLGLISQTIRSATESLTNKMDKLVASSIAEDSKQNVVIPAPKTVIKEQYIPLGSGSTNSTTWVDLYGVEANVAPSNYGSIVSMYFEAAIRIPTGNGKVYARLINVTDNNSLFESEVSREGTIGGLVSSGKIPVPTTTKLYRAQLRSSIGADVVLDNARIKLFTQ